MLLTIILSIVLPAITTWLILCWYTAHQEKQLDRLADTIEKIIDLKIKSNDHDI